MNRKEKLELAKIMEDNLYEFGYPYPISDEGKTRIMKTTNKLRGSFQSPMKEKKEQQ